MYDYDVSTYLEQRRGLAPLQTFAAAVVSWKMRSPCQCQGSCLTYFMTSSPLGPALDGTSIRDQQLAWEGRTRRLED
jgi:hypothetical protein